MASSRRDWDVFLIKEVSKTPHLYKQKYRKTAYANMRKNCWKNIAKAVFNKTDSKTVNTIKKRWKIIRGAYVKKMSGHHKNSNKSKSFMSEDQEGSKLRFPYEKELRFLDFLGDESIAVTHQNMLRYLEKIRSGSDLIPIDEIKVEPECLNEQVFHTLQFEKNCENSYKCSSTINFTKRRFQSRPLTNSNGRSYAAMSTSSTKAHQPQPYVSFVGLDGILSDNTDTFFIYVARSTAKLDTVSAIKVKKEIANLVFDAEIEELTEHEI